MTHVLRICCSFLRRVNYSLKVLKVAEIVSSIWQKYAQTYSCSPTTTQAFPKFFSQEQFCSMVQNFRSKFGLTRSRKCVHYENGPKVEGANLLLSYFFRSKCPRTSRKLHICGCKFWALVGGKGEQKLTGRIKLENDAHKWIYDINWKIRPRVPCYWWYPMSVNE